MSDQMNVQDYLSLRSRIGDALVALRPPNAGVPPLGEYFPEYAGTRDIPDERLEYVCKSLEAHVKCRAKVGDAAYFSRRSIRAMLDTYLEALLDVEHEYLIKEGRNADSGGNWVDLKLRFSRQLEAAMAGVCSL